MPLTSPFRPDTRTPSASASTVRRPRVDIVFPAFPPQLDGIGDHTAQIARALSPRADVRVLTAEESPREVPDVDVLSAFTLSPAQGILDLADPISEDPPDWLLIQYNPFSYGRWGFNPSLPLLVWKLRQRNDAPRIALMVHEPFVPGDRWQEYAMTVWQRAQLWSLGQLSDVVFFSIAPWVERLGSWFSHAVVRHLPIGSNIPRVPCDRAAARAAMGFSPMSFVIGLFGSAHPSRLLHFVRAAAERIREEVPSTYLLYVGAAGDAVREQIPSVPVVDAGPLPASEVSRCFTCMDLYLAPFRKGVSTRRGSFMTGIQHGTPTITTTGIHTDDVLQHEHGRSFLLTPDDDPEHFAQVAAQLATNTARRVKLGRQAERYFDAHFEWTHLADRLMTTLSDVDPHAVSPLSVSSGRTPQ